MSLVWMVRLAICSSGDESPPTLISPHPLTVASRPEYSAKSWYPVEESEDRAGRHTGEAAREKVIEEERVRMETS